MSGTFEWPLAIGLAEPAVPGVGIISRRLDERMVLLAGSG